MSGTQSRTCFISSSSLSGMMNHPYTQSCTVLTSGHMNDTCKIDTCGVIEHETAATCGGKKTVKTQRQAWLVLLLVADWNHLSVSGPLFALLRWGNGEEWGKDLQRKLNSGFRSVRERCPPQDAMADEKSWGKYYLNRLPCSLKMCVEWWQLRGVSSGLVHQNWGRVNPKNNAFVSKGLRLL